jgi:hypothetical protein
MSGPNDSSEDPTAGADLKLTLPDVGAQEKPSDRFKLKVNWQTPHLEWRPVKGTDTAPPGAANPTPPPPDPEGTLAATNHYLKSGQFLFALGQPDWSHIDKAYLSMPNEKTPLLGFTQDQLRSWENDVFFRGLSRTPYLILQPASPPMLTPPPLGASAPSLFYKLPDPAAMAREPGPPRAGKMGDALGAVFDLPIMVRLRAQLNDAMQHQFFLIERDWKQSSTWGKAVIITLGATLTAEMVGTAVGVGPVRREVFKNVLGAKLPLPFVPGVSFKIYNLGRAADTVLVGEKAAADIEAKGMRVEVMVDVPKFVDTVGGLIKFIRKK